MANDAYTQQALADDASFQDRLVAALTKIAWVVLIEAGNTPNHAARVVLARTVLDDVTKYAQTLAPTFVMRTNVFGFATSYDFPSRRVVTASGDPDLESQLATDWDQMASF